MKKLIALMLLVICITCVLTHAAKAEQNDKPDYSISILDISPSGESVDKPSDVAAIFGAKKIEGAGTIIKSDGKIPIIVTNYVDLSWEPKAYTPSSITNTYGSSLGSTSDTDKRDHTYYTVTAQDITEGENATSLYATDFTFNRDIPSTCSPGNVLGMYITLYVKSPAENNRLMMYDGQWKTVRTFESTSGETIEFPAGGEYAKSNPVKIRLNSSDSSPYDIDVDVVNIMFRCSGMDVTFNAPAGTKVMLGDYYDPEAEIDYSQANKATAVFDLSDYVDFNTKDYRVSFIYSYNISIANYKLEQKTKPLISSEDKSTSIDIDYEKYFTLTAPFSQEINLEANPQLPLNFNDLTNSSTKYDVTKEDGKIRFEIDTANTVNLTYTLKNATSIKKELYKQTNSDATTLRWMSTYAISRNYDSTLGSLTLKHRLISNSSDAAITVDPSVDYTSTVENNNLTILFPEIGKSLTVTIIENSNTIITNHSTSTQLTNPILVGTSPSFKATIDLSNPSNKEMKINLTREMILAMLPEIEKYFKEVPSDVKTITLKAGESRTVPVVFNTTPATINESIVKQTPVAVNQPVEWSKTIRVANPSAFDYANVSWYVEVPDEITDYTINGDTSGENSGTQIKYLIDNLPAGKIQEYVLLYYTLPVKKTEETISNGMIDKVIEKRITLSNPNSEDVKVIAGFNISDLPNIKISDLEIQLEDYTLQDRDEDGVSDYVKWETVVEANSDKVVVLNSTSGDIMKSMPSVNLDSGSINLNLLSGFGDNMLPLILLVGFIGIVFVFVLIVRTNRRNRRKRMILYIAGTNDAVRSLSGASKQPSLKQ